MKKKASRRKKDDEKSVEQEFATDLAALTNRPRYSGIASVCVYEGGEGQAVVSSNITSVAMSLGLIEWARLVAQDFVLSRVQTKSK